MANDCIKRPLAYSTLTPKMMKYINCDKLIIKQILQNKQFFFNLIFFEKISNNLSGKYLQNGLNSNLFQRNVNITVYKQNMSSKIHNPRNSSFVPILEYSILLALVIL